MSVALAILVAGSPIALPPELMAEDAKVYARAHWNLRAGAIDFALRDLDAYQKTTRLLVDRCHLMRAQALETRRDLQGAKRSFGEALKTAASPAVSDAALRGLISVSSKLGDFAAELEYLDELFEGADEPEPALELEQVTVLM